MQILLDSVLDRIFLKFDQESLISTLLYDHIETQRLLNRRNKGYIVLVQFYLEAKKLKIITTAVSDVEIAQPLFRLFIVRILKAERIASQQADLSIAECFTYVDA